MSEARMDIDGRCHCGAIRYEARVNPETVVICHSTDCQTFSGAPYRVSVMVRLEDFRQSAQPWAGDIRDVPVVGPPK